MSTDTGETIKVGNRRGDRIIEPEDRDIARVGIGTIRHEGCRCHRMDPNWVCVRNGGWPGMNEDASRRGLIVRLADGSVRVELEGDRTRKLCPSVPTSRETAFP